MNGKNGLKCFHKSEKADLLHAKCKIFSNSVRQYAIPAQTVNFIVPFNESFRVIKNVEWFQNVTISKNNYFEPFKVLYLGILQSYETCLL